MSCRYGDAKLFASVADMYARMQASLKSELPVNTFDRLKRALRPAGSSLSLSKWRHKGQQFPPRLAVQLEGSIFWNDERMGQSAREGSKGPAIASPRSLFSSLFRTDGRRI